MDKQVIISISREYGSGGHEIARLIAEHFGLNLYDRSILDEISRSSNIKIDVLEKYEEKPRNIYLSRRVGSYSNSISEIITEMQFEFIREKAKKGESFVIVGRCANTIIRDNKGLISFFILGDKEAKISRIREVFNISGPEAEYKIKRHDRTRKNYHNSHSYFRWGDSRYYDLSINSSRLGIEMTAECLENYINKRIERI